MMVSCPGRKPGATIRQLTMTVMLYFALISLWLLPFAVIPVCSCIDTPVHRSGSSSLGMVGAYMHHQKQCHEVDETCQASNKMPLNSSNANVDLTHCLLDPEDNRRGVFIFNRANSSMLGAHDVYRIRMLGHEMLLPRLYACNDTCVIAPYNILIGGLYRVEILQVYDNFTFDTPPQLRTIESMGLASFEMEVRSPDKNWGCAWEEECPACTTADAAGRWIVKNPWLLGNFSNCNAYVGFESDAVNCSLPQHHSLSFRRNAIPNMSWQPYTCKVVSAEDIDMEGCLRDQKICLVGDSQMRHIYAGVTSLILKDTTYHNSDVERGQWDSNVVGLDNIIYYLDKWGHPWSQHNLLECTDVLANFGQWPASRETGSGFWPAHQYKLAAQNNADFLSLLGREGKRASWVTTPSHPLNPGLTGVDDWRTDPLLSLYNRLSQDVLDEDLIGIIDTFSITSPLNELSYDGHHYKGLMAYNVDLMILNAICS